MSIQRIGVYSHHPELRSSAVMSFSSEEKDKKVYVSENKKPLLDIAQELQKLREQDIYFNNAKNLIIASTTIGVAATGIWLYLKARGPVLIESLLQSKLLRR